MKTPLIRRVTSLCMFIFVLAAPLPLRAGSSTYVEPTLQMSFERIPGGSFIMGDVYGNDPYAKPPRKVTLTPFYIGTHEVTFDQYDVFCLEMKRERPSDAGFGRGNRPVINVSWQDARDFAAWLSRKAGRTFRLPSEAEWEYAARGGKTTDYWWGPTLGSGNAVCKTCNTPWDGLSTAPVDTLRPNPYGLYHVLGNVYEWVADDWQESYAGAPPTAAP